MYQFNDKNISYCIQMIFHIVGTCKCPEHLYANWYDAKPYVVKNGPRKLSGLFPELLNIIIPQACGSCNPSYNQTTLKLFETKTGISPEKTTEAKLRLTINKNVDFSFPVYGKTDGHGYSTDSGGIFLPIVMSPGSAIVVRDEQKSRNKLPALLKTVGNTWPMFLVTFLITLITGYLIWFTVSS